MNKKIRNHPAFFKARSLFMDSYSLEMVCNTVKKEYPNDTPETLAPIIKLAQEDAEILGLLSCI